MKNVCSTAHFQSQVLLHPESPFHANTCSPSGHVQLCIRVLSWSPFHAQWGCCDEDPSAKQYPASLICGLCPPAPCNYSVCSSTSLPGNSRCAKQNQPNSTTDSLRHHIWFVHWSNLELEVNCHELPWALRIAPLPWFATSVPVTCSLFNDLPSEVVRDNVGGGTWQVRAGRRTNLTGTERRMWTDAVKIWYRGPERPKIIKDHWENAIFVVEDFRWFSVAAHQALIFAGIFLASVFGLYWMAYGFGDDKQDGISSANLKASNSQMRSSALMFRCFPSSSSFCFFVFLHQSISHHR